MNRRVSLLSAAVGASLIAAALPMSAFSADFRAARNPVQGQYIVVLKEGAASLAGERSSAARVSVVARDMAGKHRAKVVRSFDRALRGFVAQADDAALARLLADPNVAYVEEDGIVSINATQTGATWGIDRVDQRDLPLNSTYNYDTTASNVHAYVIDTGVLLAHSQFTGRMGNGFDAVTTGGNANDCHGHGTHVAGTVGGTTYGIAKGVTIHPVRVLGCTGSGTNAGVIAGMDWVANNHVKPAVANMSLGGGFSQATNDAVARMTNAGVTVVVAAGNDNGDACTKSPASAASAITVGSTTTTDARSSFSNFGTCVDIFGPGSSITSSWYTSTTATNTISGTSMASPHVAGVAALYLANNATATPAQVTTAIINNSTPNKVTSPGTGSPNRLLYSLFGAAPVTFSISGTITTSAGAGISGVSVSNGTTTVTTNASGAYTLPGLSNGTYTLTPSLSGFTFSPASRSVAVSGANVTGQNFTGTATGGGGVQTYTNGTDVTIIDLGTVESPITVSGRTGNAPTNASISVNIVHTYRGDLVVDLVAPDGSVYNLHNRSGGSADNLVATYSRNLSTEALNGTWRLRVRDAAAADVGRIDTWSITF